MTDHARLLLKVTSCVLIARLLNLLATTESLPKSGCEVELDRRKRTFLQSKNKTYFFLGLVHSVYCCSCLLVRGKQSEMLISWFAVTVTASPPSPTIKILSGLLILAAAALLLSFF